MALASLVEAHKELNLSCSAMINKLAAMSPEDLGRAYGEDTTDSIGEEGGGVPFQFFSKLLEIWNLDDSQRDIFSGNLQIETRDAKDRIAELFVIRKILFGIFRNRKVENQWLREPQEILGGASPLDLLLEGSWSNLLRVRQLTELMAGL